MPSLFPVLLTEIEAKALLEAVNRAWDTTPAGTQKRAIDRAAGRIEEALRLNQAGRIPERGAA